MKPTKSKSRTLVLRPETVVVLTRTRLAEIAAGNSSGPCETLHSNAILCGDQDPQGV